MNATELLHHLSENAEALSMSERVLGGVIVTLLAMAIVFIVLIVLIFAIKAMGAILGTSAKEEKKAPAPQAQIVEEEEEVEDEGELVAVISAAVAQSLGRGVNEIVVTKVRRTQALPTWTKSGALN